jgi:3-oxoacyl-[acyl-carrier protein] reductase
VIGQKNFAIVTGANRGIGLAVSERLAADGYRVAACVRSGSEALDSLVAAGNGHHAVFTIDLADEESIKTAAREILGWADRPVALVNCAALALGGLFSMTRMQDLRDLYQINLFGPLLLAQYVTKKMLRTKAGSIVNIASTAGLLADAGTLGYGGTKASLIHASRVMATELGVFGIRVNVIAPSVVETDMADLMDEAARRKLDDRSALPGAIQAVDVANVVSFLVSPCSAKVSGQVLRIDRGMPF